MTVNSSLLWSLEETAYQLGGISKSTVRRLIHQGELSSCRVGLRLLRIPADSVLAYIDRVVTPVLHAKRVSAVMSQDVAVVTQQAENLDCAESVACKELKPCHIDEKIHPTGGLNTPTQAANQLTNLLEQLTGKKRQHSKQSGVSKFIIKKSGASSPNILLMS